MTTETIRVVIVDDQAAFRSAARMVVDVSPGFEVVGEAESGEDGVDLVSRLVPDLVLMDVNLPGIDGLEATRRIVAAGDARVVLVLSTYSAEEFADRAIAAGAATFISKADLDPMALQAAWDAAVAGDGTA